MVLLNFVGVATWERVEDLPFPLYRHQAVKVGHRVLICTGRINSQEISSAYLLWSRQFGWESCILHGDIPPPTYGTTLIGFTASNPSHTQTLGHGIVSGGISADCVLEQGVWEWELDHDGQHPNVHFHHSSILLGKLEHQQYITRFGASVVSHDDKTYICGGIVKDMIMSVPDEICAINSRYSLNRIHGSSQNDPLPRPLLIGTTFISVNGTLVHAGGGATCFVRQFCPSFSSKWIF